MNLNGISKKLQRAIIQTGLIVKVGTTQFYSNEQKRLINGKRYLPFTVYTVIFVLDVLVSFVLP